MLLGLGAGILLKGKMMSKLKDVYKEVPNWRETHKGMNRPEYVLKNGSARNCYGLLKDIHCLQEENQRLTEIATKHATRADELYEALESTNKELYFLINEVNKYRAKDVRCDQLDPPELHDMETCHLNAVLLDKSRIEAEQDDA